MKKIKLTNLNVSSLSSNEMHNLNGGGYNPCSCACFFASEGGHSSHANANKNSDRHPQDPPTNDEV